MSQELKKRKYDSENSKDDIKTEKLELGKRYIINCRGFEKIELTKVMVDKIPLLKDLWEDCDEEYLCDFKSDDIHNMMDFMIGDNEMNIKLSDRLKCILKFFLVDFSVHSDREEKQSLPSDSEIERRAIENNRKIIYWHTFESVELEKLIKELYMKPNNMFERFLGFLSQLAGTNYKDRECLERFRDMLQRNYGNRSVDHWVLYDFTKELDPILYQFIKDSLIKILSI